MRLPSHLARNCALSEKPLLSSLTTAGVGGPARNGLAEPDSEGTLSALVAYLRSESIRWRVIGAGSNILAPDSGIDTLLVATRRLGRISRNDENAPLLTAGAGVSLPSLVAFCCRAGLSGVEALAGIPGTVGGAIKMNAGGRHGDMAQVIESVRVLDREGSVESRSASDCGLVYRGSALGDATVTQAVLRLTGSTPERVRQATDAIMSEKRASQPLSEKSCGCVFKNPPGYHAGKLIDDAGLKGSRCGGASISTRHAAFIVNEGGATRRDYDALIEQVHTRVRELYGVDLETEVELW